MTTAEDAGAGLKLGQTEAETPVISWWGGPFPVLRLAVGFGLAAGLVELLLLILRVDGFGNGVYLRSPHFLWMVPVSDLILFTVTGFMLALVARFWRSGKTPVVIVGVFVFLACLGQLLLIRGLYAYACVLLAGGIAVQLAPRVIKHRARFLSVVRLAIPVMAGVVVLLASWTFGREALALRRALAGRAAASREAPNVLLVVMDTVRADRLSLYNYKRDTTPFLARLAARGVRFDAAHSAAPWTLPSHATLFTGRWPHELDTERLGRLDATYPTLAEYLRGLGYSTVGVVANQFFCGFQTGLSRGFDEYRDYPLNLGEVVRSSSLGWLLSRNARRLGGAVLARVTGNPGAGVSLDFERKPATDVNREFLGWLSRRPPSARPFFAFLNYFDVHDPYLVPPGKTPRFGRIPRSRAEANVLAHWQDVVRAPVSPEALALARDAYDDCIASLDRQLETLFRALDDRGLLDQTLVIITADHGEQFGEHKGFRHGVSLYEEEVHVPLLIVGPRVPAGRVVSDFVSLRDVPATVADLLGSNKPPRFPGRSLVSAWETPGAALEPPFAALNSTIEPTGERPDAHASPAGPLQALFAEGHSYIRHADGVEELYNLAADPSQSHDLRSSADSAAVLDRLRKALERRVREGSSSG